MTATMSLPMVSSNQQQSKKRWLIVDYDGTCTQGDTTGLLPELAAMLSSDNVQERVQDFDVHVKEYIRLYDEAKERLCHESMSLEDALDSLDQVSTVVTEQVSSSRVLQGLGVPPKDILELIEKDEQVADRVKLHEGCLDVLSRHASNDWQIGVLSINWCPSLIHATVVSPLQSKLEPQITMDIPIWSNTVDSSGAVSLKVPGALAKRACIAKLQPSSFVVYVGDSSTDLLALMEADLGILIDSCQPTIETAKRFGVCVLPLSQRRDALINTCNVIWTAESWSEIDRALKELTDEYNT